MRLAYDTRIRQLGGDIWYNTEVEKIDIRGEKTETVCKAGESLLWAMEHAGIKAPNHCRSGECGWCHSRLVSGYVYVPEDADGRRMADKKFGWIHPCISYPLTDIEIAVYPIEE